MPTTKSSQVKPSQVKSSLLPSRRSVIQSVSQSVIQSGSWLETIYLGILLACGAITNVDCATIVVRFDKGEIEEEGKGREGGLTRSGVGWGEEMGMTSFLTVYPDLILI